MSVTMETAGSWHIMLSGGGNFGTIPESKGKDKKCEGRKGGVGEEL